MWVVAGVWREGWLWLGGSLLLSAAWANIAWFFRDDRPGIAGEAVAHLIAWRFAPELFQALRLLYYVGVPFAALLWGHDAVIGRLLGLQRLTMATQNDVSVFASWRDWAHDVRWTAALGLGAWGMLALAGWIYRRALIHAGITDADAEVDTYGWILLREAAYSEIHWAFYRNAPIVALGMYWGVWVGLGLVALEALTNPAWRGGLSDPRRAPAQLLRAALAAVSTMFFLRTQNLWLAVVLHWLVSWGLAALYQAPIAVVEKETGRGKASI